MFGKLKAFGKKKIDWSKPYGMGAKAKEEDEMKTEAKEQEAQEVQEAVMVFVECDACTQKNGVYTDEKKFNCCYCGHKNEFKELEVVKEEVGV